MKVYVFGNEDEDIDNKPLEILDKLIKDFRDVEFIVVKPNADVPFTDEDEVLIVDTVEGINEVKVFDDSQLEKFCALSGVSVHDYDLGFQLKYLKKLGKIRKVTVIGIPMNCETNYASFHSTFKKLVAQDMQGS